MPNKTKEVIQMSETTNLGTFCPFTDKKCVKDECIMWIENECMWFEYYFQTAMDIQDRRYRRPEVEIC